MERRERQRQEHRSGQQVGSTTARHHPTGTTAALGAHADAAFRTLKENNRDSGLPRPEAE